MGGVKADFRDTSFRHASVRNGNGGVIVVSSDFSLMDATERSVADFTRCTFSEFAADFYGSAVFSSISQLRMFDSHIASAVAETNATALSSGTVFDFGVNSDCRSGCGPGQYGTCEAIDGCFSCDIGVCNAWCVVGVGVGVGVGREGRKEIGSGLGG